MKTVMILQPRRLAQAIAMAALLAPVAVSAALPASARPDAGRLTRELQQPVMPSKPSAEFSIPSPLDSVLQPGGAKVTIQSVKFFGNSKFTSEQLAAILADDLKQPLDLAGIQALADKISSYYREQGYGFARAFVTEHALMNGVLTITIVEGKYGVIRIEADSAHRAAQAMPFLRHAQPLQAIYVPSLERDLLLLGDQPGYSVEPVIKPGKAVGTGDLDVKLTRKKRLNGQVSLSNHGNRYTGYYLAGATVRADSPFRFGDQLSLGVQASDERLKSATISYNTPLGGSGLRGTVGYSITDYTLAREFANLQASGRAQITSAGLSYPLIRSRKTNLTVSAQGQHKRFYDEQKAVASVQSRASDAGSLSVNFDHLDGRGLTYGQLEYVSGRFSGPQPNTAGTLGKFSRANADVVRLQRLGKGWSLMLRANGQKARKNLDSSESYTLGGPYAVRAYPTGEGNGDEGAFGQFEVRYQLNDKLAPFAFYDAGRVRLEHKATVAGSNKRTLAGAGLGLRYRYNALNIEAVVARPMVGGDPQTDPRNEAVTGWLTIGYVF